jgi:hypothetical protein
MYNAYFKMLGCELLAEISLKKKKELDNMEGGRRVTRADVKAWLKNRF